VLTGTIGTERRGGKDFRAETKAASCCLRAFPAFLSGRVKRKMAIKAAAVNSRAIIKSFQKIKGGLFLC